MSGGTRLDTLLVGSSIFQEWAGYRDALPAGESVNAAVNGSTSRDWIARLPVLLDSLRPELVVCYAGSNDSHNGIAERETRHNVQALAEMTAARGRFAYVAILQSPAKRDHWDVLARLTAHVKTHLPPHAVCLDANDALRTGGEPDPACYVADGVHLTDLGYRRLAESLGPQLAAADEGR